MENEQDHPALKGLLEIMTTADDGCSECVAKLFEQVEEQFPYLLPVINDVREAWYKT